MSKLTAPSSTDLIDTTTERHLAKEAATFGYPRVRMFCTAGQTTFGYLRQAPWQTAGDGFLPQMRERQICSACTAIQRDTDDGTFGTGCDLNRCRITNWLSSMAENHSTKGHPTKGHSQRHGGTPLVVASAVAAFGVLAILIVDHGPWNKPKVQPAVMATYSTTGEAARAVGATITPTEPKPAIKPLPAGPKPVDPVNPPTPLNPPTPP